jgi:Na+/phosphate symporter
MPIYKNTYLEKVGELMKNCMELSKNVETSLMEIEGFVKELTNVEQIKDVFKEDINYIKELYIDGDISEEEAKENITRLKGYVTKQLEYHYNLMPTLLADLEKHLNELNQRILRELVSQHRAMPESLKEEIEEAIDETEKEFKM